MKISTAILVSLTLAAALTGCSKAPPKCSDEDTFSLVRKIVLDQIGDSEGLSETEILQNMRIDVPRASAFDEKIKKFSCEAKLIVGGKIQLPITYESQLDDNNQHVVAVDGIAKGDLYVLHYSLEEAIKESRAMSQPPTPKPAKVQPAPFNTADLLGKNSASALDNEALKGRFKLLLGDNLTGFRERLNVSGDITQEGEWLVGEGGMPHLFSMEEAAFAINSRTGEIFAIMLTEGKNLNWFGTTVVSDLPLPLQTWYKSHGGS
ncbi:hypothetical protein H8K52_09775 [Undibacterium seohonense]|jgi:hypothetical protein|uniref:Lipoprotein n=1 Tax=Undibacterium seohonense TaxID=1344950 RepID=A0ABR6X461_9BURK|nr:hypothetical protein [Undibacterium seohonense]MBC3807630.1 hypothetical protein [Undibacterium seohonense]